MNVVITGASRGLGLALAERFASGGHNLYLTAHYMPGLDRVSRDLVSRNPALEIQARAFDLSKDWEAQACGKWIVDQGFFLDVLINNAGQFLPGSIYQEAAGTLQTLLNVNLFSAYHLTRSLLPKMVEQKRGHIFNLCSIASLQAYPGGGSYSISKFALAGFSKNLREEMRPHGVKVTAVFPGAVYTDSWADSGVSPDRIMAPSDVADMIYAASQLSARATVEDIVLRPQQGDI
jgi:short-subunit dehydrogenase